MSSSHSTRRIDNGSAGPRFVGPRLRDGGQRFVIERPLGVGGMGVVYLAQDRERSMQVALKTLHDHDPVHLARFKREFRSLADVAHPGLVSLYELFADDGAWFFTMEAIDGEHFDRYLGADPSPPEVSAAVPTRLQLEATLPELTLDESLQPPAPVRARRTAQLADLERLDGALASLCDALEALHGAGMSHCDLKPSNVLVTREGRVVVLDFGLTRPAARHTESPRNLEGTPHYVAPELVRGEPPSAASDWYAVGAMLFRALAGRVPVPGDSWQQVFTRLMHEDTTKVATLVSGVPGALAELVDGLLHKDPARRHGAAAVRAYLDGTPARPRSEHATTAGELELVGRHVELARLEEALAVAATGAPTFALVSGPSGIGKSALTRHFVDALVRERRAHVFAGRCYEREQVPYKALDGVVDAIANYLLEHPESLVEVPSGLAALAVLFPVLQAVPAIAALPPVSAALEASDVRELASRAIPALLGQLSADLPMVLSIDDLQWGDPDSAALLDEIIDPSSRTRVLFLANSRTDAAESQVVRVVRARAARLHEIELGALGHDECVKLARSVSRSEADAESIAREAKGLPFFAVELARWTARDHAVRELPRGIDDLLVARVRALPADARRLLEAAALVGVPQPGALLARAAGLDSNPLPLVRMLGAQSLLRTHSVVSQQVETYHDRVREVVTAQLEPGARRRLHQGLGDALAAQDDADPELVARHLLHGEEPQRAQPFLLAAGRRAASTLAFERAVGLYRTAYAQASPEEHGRLTWLLAEALVSAGRSAEAASLFAERARVAHTESERSRARRRAATEWLKCGMLDQGVAELRHVLRDVGLRYPDSQAEARVRAVLRILRIVRWRGQFAERQEGELAPELLARMDAVRAAGIAFILVDPLRGYGFLALFLLDARAAGEPRRVAVGLAFNAITLCVGGSPRFARAQAWLDIARGIAERVDDDYLRGLADSCEAGVRICTGEWRLAERLATAAVPRLRATQTSATAEITATHAVMRAALFFSGSLLAMRDQAGRHFRAADAVGDRFAATYAQVHRWIEAAMDDDVPRGRAQLAEALSTWSSLGFHVMHWWALFGELHYDLYEQDYAGGLARLERARPALKSSRMLGIMQVYRIWSTATEAILRLGVGGPRQRRAAAKLAQALDHEKLGYARGFAAMIRARLHHRDPARALRECVRAAELFDAAHMRLHAAGARVLHGRLGGGAEGAAAERDGLQVLAAQGIARPERWLHLLGVG